MFEKVAVLLVLVVVVVQSYVSYDAKEQYARFDINSDHLIQDLKELTEQASKTANETLYYLNHYWDVKYHDIYNTAEAKIILYLLDHSKKIALLQEEALRLKVDIISCDPSQEEIQRAAEFEEGIKVCVKDIVNMVAALVEKKQKTEAKSMDIIKILAAEYEACEQPSCKAIVGVKIARAMSEIPAMIRRSVDEAVPNIMSIVPGTEKCVRWPTDLLIFQEIKIAEKVISCITEKLHPQ